MITCSHLIRGINGILIVLVVSNNYSQRNARTVRHNHKHIPKCNALYFMRLAAGPNAFKQLLAKT